MVSDKKADVEAVKGLFESFRVRPSFENWISLMAEDMILIRPNAQSLCGIEAVKKLFEPWFEEYITTFEIGDIEIEVDSSLAYVRFGGKERYRLRDGGETTTVSLKGLYILRRINGNWKFTRGIWNREPRS